MLWQQDLGQLSRDKKLMGIYVTDNLLLTGCRDGSLFYFNSQTGVWKGVTTLQTPPTRPPIMHENRLYTVDNMAISRVNPETGSISKTIPALLPINTTPVYWNGNIVIGGANGRVACIDIESEAQLWSVGTDGATEDPIIARDYTIYASAYRGSVLVVNAIDGTKEWEWRPDPPSQLTSGIAMRDDVIYAGGNRGYIYALNKTEGTVMWKYPVGSPITKILTCQDDKLLVFTHNNKVVCLGQKGNEMPRELWAYPSATRLLMAGDSSFYFKTADGHIANVVANTGEQKWRIPHVEECIFTTHHDGSTLYLALPTGEIAAISEIN
jgi:outer membrane protein assembly factor BamB